MSRPQDKHLIPLTERSEEEAHAIRSAGGKAAQEKRKQQRLMTELLQKKVGKEPILLIPDIYEGGKQYIASFAPIIFEAYRLGDAVAVEAVETNVKLLSNLIRAALRDFDGLEKAVPVVLCGGLCAHASVIVPIMERNLRDSRYSEIRIMTEKPVHGAVINARKVFEDLIKEHNESN